MLSSSSSSPSAAAAAAELTRRPLEMLSGVVQLSGTKAKRENVKNSGQYKNVLKLQRISLQFLAEAET